MMQPALPPNPRLLPPPIAQHLREFAQRPTAWAILARNLIPVVGIYLFDWSASLATFSYWFDGLVALLAIVTALVPRAMRESQPKPEGIVGYINYGLAAIFVGVLLGGVLALPYWIVLIPLHDILLGTEVRTELAHSVALQATFGAMAIGNFAKAIRVGYGAMPEVELKQRARWDMYLLVLRAVAMFMMASPGLAFLIVPLMALLLTYFEVWPERVIGAFFGDPKRLHEYDPETHRPKKRKPRK